MPTTGPQEPVTSSLQDVAKHFQDSLFLFFIFALFMRQPLYGAWGDHETHFVDQADLKLAVAFAYAFQCARIIEIF